ncbi:MAG: hypothetical protein SGILL_008312, partial [Bacillariaceae sp.]
SRLSRRLAVGMDGSVSGQEENMDRSFATSSSIQDSHLGEEEGEEAILVLNDDEYAWNPKSTGNKKRCILCTALVLFVAAIVIGVTVPLVNKKNSSNQQISMFSGAMTQLEACQAGFFLDTKEPHLEIHMRGITQEITDPESISMLENAVAIGYNEASGGCADVYSRVMFSAKLQGQQVVRDLVLTDQAVESLETLFEETTVMIAQFSTMIACDGCPPDEGFASVYPATYRANRKRRALETEDSAVPNDAVQPLFSNLEQALDAADIVMAIEKSVRNVLLDLDGFQEVTILSKSDDGSSAATTLYEQTDDNDAYQPSFFRNKAIRDAQNFRDCEMAKKKRSKGSSSTKSSKSSKTDAPTTTPATDSPTATPETDSPTVPRTRSPSIGPSAAPQAKSTKAPKSSKAPTVKQTKAPKAASIKATKSPNAKSSKAPTASTTSITTCDDESVTVGSASAEKSSKAPTVKSSKAPTVKSSKAPTVKSSKAPTVKSSKAPTVKSSKAPTVQSSKAPTVKSSKAPTVKSTKAAAATTTTATVSREQIGEHPACSVCGGGKVMTNPSGTFEPPGQRQTQCLALKMAGTNGFIPGDSCPLIPALIDGPCGCA